MTQTLSRKSFLSATLSSIGLGLLGGCGDDAGTTAGEAGAANSPAGQAGMGGAQATGQGGMAPQGQAGLAQGQGGMAPQGQAGMGQGQAGLAQGQGGMAPQGQAGMGQGGSGVGGVGGMGTSQCADTLSAEISGNHGHALSVPLDDILAGVTKTYDSAGTAGHSHFVQITAADFATLASGGTLIKTSCNGGDHEYVLSCAVADRAAAAPVCSDECGNADGSFCPG